MKKLITITLLASFLTLNGCKDGKLNVPNPMITVTIATGVALAFKYIPMDTSKRALIANYVSGIAGGARAATGTETSDDLAKLLVSKVPAEVMSEFPAIGTAVIPMVVSYFEQAKKEFGSDYQGFMDRMNAVATGLEQGVAQYISKQ